MRGSGSGMNEGDLEWIEWGEWEWNEKGWSGSGMSLGEKEWMSGGGLEGVRQKIKLGRRAGEGEGVDCEAGGVVNMFLLQKLYELD